jgi:surface glycoprotein (TIGR04207 family)
MTGSNSKTKLRATFLAVVMVMSVAVGSVAFSGGAVAASVNVSVQELADEPIDAQTEQFAGPGEDITVNYTINPESNDVSIRSATVIFEAVNDNTVVERSVTADSVENREEDVEVPNEEGFYEVTLEATDEDGDDHSESVSDGSDGFLVVHSKEPTVNVQSPTDGPRTMLPVVDGDAFDGAGVQNVTLTIKNSSDYYWNGSSGSEEWESSEVAFEVYSTNGVQYGQTVDWRYDLSGHSDKFDPGEYTITANAYDGQGNTISDPGSGPPSATNDEDTGPESVVFELVKAQPYITEIEFLESDLTTQTESIRVGNELGINVTVDPRETATDSIGPATIESADLGIDGASLGNVTSYSDGDKIRYQGTVTINKSQPTAPGGRVDVTAKVGAPTGDVTRDDTVELIREPAAVQSFAVETDFIGFVRDDASSIDVSLGTVVDEAKSPVDVGGNNDLKVRVGGEVVASDISVSNGEVDSSVAINPDDDLSAENQSPGETPVEVVYSDSQGTETVIGEFDVKLVHEAYGLKSDQYQPVGTPMQATDVSIDSSDVPNVITWDPAAEGGNGTWTTDFDETRAGAGYFVYTEDSDARIGYTFETGSVSASDETLKGGTSESQFHLVGATTILQDSDSNSFSIGDDLKGGDASNVDSDKVTPWTAGKAPWIGPSPGEDSVGWGSAETEETVKQFEAYWVEVDSNEELIRAFQTDGYDPEAREE